MQHIENLAWHRNSDYKLGISHYELNLTMQLLPYPIQKCQC